MQVMTDFVVMKIASGGDHLVALTDSGEVYTVGCAEQGQLGRVAECFSQRGGRKGMGESWAIARWENIKNIIHTLKEGVPLRLLYGGIEYFSESVFSCRVYLN